MKTDFFILTATMSSATIDKWNKLETLIGRELTLEFIKENAGIVNYKYSPTNEELFNLRQKINEEILKNI